MYEAPANVDFREASIVRSLTLHCKRLFPQLEFVISRSHDNNFIIVLRQESPSILEFSMSYSLGCQI